MSLFDRFEREHIALAVVLILTCGLGLTMTLEFVTRDPKTLSVQTATIGRLIKVSEYSPSGATAGGWKVELHRQDGSIVEGDMPFLPKTDESVCVVELVDKDLRYSYVVVGYIDALARSGQACEFSNDRFH